MRTRTVRWVPVLMLAGTVLSGCHNYHVVETPSIGSIVRVRVPVTSALDAPNAAPRTTSLEGQVVSVGETLLLATKSSRSYGAYREVVQFDTISLRAEQVSVIEVREFSSRKSVLMGVVITAGALAAGITAFNSAKNGGNPEVPGPPPPQSAIVVSNSLISMIWGLIGS
jgi:hypothetical protein